MNALLIIEKPDHPDPEERRVVSEWMPIASALAWRERYLRRAGQLGVYVDVTVVPAPKVRAK